MSIARFLGLVLLLAVTAASQEVETKHLKLSSRAGAWEVQPLQTVSLALDIDLKPGMHVYAPEVEGTYIPVSWRMPSSPAFKANDVAYPKSKRLRLEAIDETVPVYEGRLQLTRELVVGAAKDLQPLLKNGELTIEGTFRYQACDDKMCYRPETVPLRWTFRVKGS
ncbi:MAG: hypothetical protein KIT09_08750 [Bryobacteraceae bacterium]|nr:hypothetical protein [Bryobacteraceae bacterium]